jgi:dihydrofolate reductase
MRFRVYMAVSLDGFIADADGDVAWLDPYFDEDYGYASFVAGIGCAVMGRVTYEQVRGFGEWPYEGFDVHVLAGSPPTDLPPSVHAWTGTPGELARELEAAGSEGDCWVVGGGRTIRSFGELGLIDEYQLFVMPVLLGTGVRLFPTPYPDSRLILRSVARWENGVVGLRYGTTYAEDGEEAEDVS